MTSSEAAVITQQERRRSGTCAPFRNDFARLRGPMRRRQRRHARFVHFVAGREGGGTRARACDIIPFPSCAIGRASDGKEFTWLRWTKCAICWRPRCWTSCPTGFGPNSVDLALGIDCLEHLRMSVSRRLVRRARATKPKRLVVQMRRHRWPWRGRTCYTYRMDIF